MSACTTSTIQARSRRSDTGEDGQDCELTCDFIAGCDGFHGICRPSIPAGVLAEYERIYPFGWLGILAEAPPSSEELIYTYHDRGFALLSMRSEKISRLYLQCKPDEDIDLWPDEKIWQELHTRARRKRLALTQGPVLQKGVTGMRSFVVEPMQYGRTVSRRRLRSHRATDGRQGPEPCGRRCSRAGTGSCGFLCCRASELARCVILQTCLRRVWKVQRFSWWMTSMLHRFPDENPFDSRRQLAELDYVTSSRAAAQSLAENYVGLPMEW